MKLSDLVIKRTKASEKALRMFDGGGLYLQVEPTGGKLWRYKYRFEGKEKLLSLGTYPEVSLLEARRRHFEAREKLAQGIDPSAAKKATKAARLGLVENSFEVVARKWFENWKLDKSEGHVEKNKRQLERDIFPYIGNIPVAELKAPHVLEVCRRVEARGVVETAHRAKMTIGLVMLQGVRGEINIIYG